MKLLQLLSPSLPRRRFVHAMAFSAFAAVVAGTTGAAAPATSPASGFHDQVVSEYLDGNWSNWKPTWRRQRDRPG